MGKELRDLIFLVVLLLASFGLHASEFTEAGTRLRLMPGSELHLSICESVARNPAYATFLPANKVMKKPGSRVPMFPVYVVHESFGPGTNGDYRPAAPVVDLIAARWNADFLTSKFYDVEAKYQGPGVEYKDEHSGLWTQLLRIKGDKDYAAFMASHSNRMQDFRFTYKGLERFQAQVVTPNYIFPVDFARSSIDGRRQGASMIRVPNQEMWDGSLRRPIARKDEIFTSKNRVHLSEKEVSALPIAVRRFKAEDILKESLGLPHEDVHYLSLEHRKINGAPIYFAVLSETDELLGYVAAFEVEIIGDRVDNIVFDYETFFSPEGRRLGQADSWEPSFAQDGLRFEEVLSLASRRLWYPVTGRNEWKFWDMGADDAANIKREKAGFLSFLNNSVKADGVDYVTELSPKKVLRRLQKRAARWSNSEKQSIALLEEWIATDRVGITVARYVQRAPASVDRESLEDHFLFFSKDQSFLYFRLPLEAR